MNDIQTKSAKALIREARLVREKNERQKRRLLNERKSLEKFIRDIKENSVISRFYGSLSEYQKKKILELCEGRRLTDIDIEEILFKCRHMFASWTDVITEVEESRIEQEIRYANDESWYEANAIREEEIERNQEKRMAEVRELLKGNDYIFDDNIPSELEKEVEEHNKRCDEDLRKKREEHLNTINYFQDIPEEVFAPIVKKLSESNIVSVDFEGKLEEKTIDVRMFIPDYKPRNYVAVSMLKTVTFESGTVVIFSDNDETTGDVFSAENIIDRGKKSTFREFIEKGTRKDEGTIFNFSQKSVMFTIKAPSGKIINFLLSHHEREMMDKNQYFQKLIQNIDDFINVSEQKQREEIAKMAEEGRKEKDKKALSIVEEI